MSEVFYFITFWLGAFSTMPIVGVKVGGHFFTAFSCFFIFFCFFLAFFALKKRKKSLFWTKEEILLLLFIIWSIIGFIIGFCILSSNWQSYTVPYVKKAIEYMAIVLLVHCFYDANLVNKFAKGLFLGCVLNCIWSICQGLVYLLLNRFLNDMIFPNSGGEIWTRYGGVRAGGFNPDPASIGVLVPIVLFYALVNKKKYLLIICFFSIIFSQSTTAIVGCVFVFSFYICFMRKSYKKINLISKKKKNRKKYFALIALLGIVGVVYFIKTGMANKVYEGVYNYIDGYVKRMNENYVEADDKGPREIYYKYALRMLFNRNPLFIIFGSGLGTSMEAYSEFNIFGIVGETTFGEIEATYLAYLFDCGVVGIILFLGFLLLVFKSLYFKLKKSGEEESVIFLGFILSVCCSNLFYHYIFAASQIMAFIFIVSFLKNNNNVRINTNSIVLYKS